MNRRIAQLMVLMMAACGILTADDGAGRQFLPPLTIGGQAFTRIETARTDEARARGLMHRTRLAPDGGMCFVFDDAMPRAFWMKNTRIPLDALFIDAYGTIVKIVTMEVEEPQRPGESQSAYERRLPSYACHGAICCVLELPAGTARILGLRPGDNIPALSWRSLHKI